MKSERPICEGKEKFETMERARLTARLLNRRKEANANAYRCRSCNAFHVGTSVGSRSKFRRPRFEEVE